MLHLHQQQWVVICITFQVCNSGSACRKLAEVPGSLARWLAVACITVLVCIYNTGLQRAWKAVFRRHETRHSGLLHILAHTAWADCIAGHGESAPALHSSPDCRWSADVRAPSLTCCSCSAHMCSAQREHLAPPAAAVVDALLAQPEQLTAVAPVHHNSSQVQVQCTTAHRCSSSARHQQAAAHDMQAAGTCSS